MDLHEEVAKVAFELYEKSGRSDGKHAEHWFEAEKIVMARLAERKEIEATGAKGLVKKDKKPLAKTKAKATAAKKTTARKSKARP